MDSSDKAEDSISSTYVFARVAEQLENDEAARSLWLKLDQEMSVGGVPSAISYLRARFKELSERFTMSLSGGGQG